MWMECDRICFASKNLYNQGLYRIITHYENTGLYKNYYALNKELISEKQVDYYAMNTKVSQQTLRKIDKNFKSYFAALKSYAKNPSSFTGRPCIPRYKHKTKGRANAEFTVQAISKKELKNGILKLANTDIRIPTKRVVKHVMVVPINNGSYKVQIIYEQKELEFKCNNKYAGIDIGLNNLSTVVSNTKLKPLIINGRPLKSINQYFNKRLAKYKSELPNYLTFDNEKKQRTSSRKINKLTHKRNCKVNDYMHKQSHALVKILKQSDISKVVIGKNDQWKTGINIGKKNNQKFVSIPHARYIHMLTYKLKLVGIEVICREESYTSKCSFLDNEDICKHDKYLGVRVKRGLFKTEFGFKWNADCNGAANILKKEIPNAFADGIEGIVVSPVRIKSHTRLKAILL
jgi:putative transposase